MKGDYKALHRIKHLEAENERLRAARNELRTGRG
jgi:hypothetical protein